MLFYDGSNNRNKYAAALFPYSVKALEKIVLEYHSPSILPYLMSIHLQPFVAIFIVYRIVFSIKIETAVTILHNYPMNFLTLVLQFKKSSPYSWSMVMSKGISLWDLNVDKIILMASLKQYNIQINQKQQCEKNYLLFIYLFIYSTHSVIHRLLINQLTHSLTYCTFRLLSWNNPQQFFIS